MICCDERLGVGKETLLLDGTFYGTYHMWTQTWICVLDTFLDKIYTGKLQHSKVLYKEPADNLYRPLFFNLSLWPYENDEMWLIKILYHQV